MPVCHNGLQHDRCPWKRRQLLRRRFLGIFLEAILPGRRCQWVPIATRNEIPRFIEVWVISIYRYVLRNTKWGRAYSDLSAQAQGFQVVVYGRDQRRFACTCQFEKYTYPAESCLHRVLDRCGGLLPADCLSTGKKSLGFINPLIYSTARTGFNDVAQSKEWHQRWVVRYLWQITTWFNLPSLLRFSAGSGSDPFTELGTPNFAKLCILLKEL